MKSEVLDLNLFFYFFYFSVILIISNKSHGPSFGFEDMKIVKVSQGQLWLSDVLYTHD